MYYFGPYSFTKEDIDLQVLSNEIGTYALGYFDETRTKLIVRYVGRSIDNGVQERLKQHIDEGDIYEAFMFSYIDNAKDAFDEECRLYHRYKGDEGKLDNKYHPARPFGEDWKCPYCDNFDDE